MPNMPMPDISNMRPQQWKFSLGYLAWVILTIWFLHSMFTPPQPRECPTAIS